MHSLTFWFISGIATINVVVVLYLIREFYKNNKNTKDDGRT